MDASRHSAGSTTATAAQRRPSRSPERIEPAPARADRARLAVGGFTPFTTTDYPGKLAAVVFAQGCPWRCRYCHNPHLLPARARSGPDRSDPVTDWRDLRDWLQTRRGLLDAVVFSGGEPTAQAALIDAVGDVAQLGFAVGLHTGGAFPRRLAEVLPQVDWVGFDLKATRAGYAALTGVAGSGTAAFAALDLLCESGASYEVRTTVHPALTPPDALMSIARELAQRGVVRWVLQGFRAVGCASDSLNEACPEPFALSADLVTRLAALVPHIELR